jgi:AbrB family looped-hinge helix DNA binding protein
MSATVTVSSKNQIVIPREAREKLNIAPGERLLVLCRDDRVILIPRPADFVKRMAGLHQEVWSEVQDYLVRERDGSES